MVSRKMAKSKNIQATRRWVVSSRKEKEVMLSMRPPPPGTGVPLESLLSWSRDPEVRAGRDWDCTTQNLDALGETTRQRFQGHLRASDMTLRWKTECTSITSSGETTTLWFVVSKKPMNRVSHTSHRACQVQGKHEGRSDRSRVRRKETQVSALVCNLLTG